MNPASFYGRSASNFEESTDEDFSSDEEVSDDFRVATLVFWESNYTNLTYFRGS